MLKNNKFSDFKSSYKKSKYVIFGVPFDSTSTFRTGSRWAPNSIRKISFNFESYNHYHQLDMKKIPVHDAGNIYPSFNIKDAIDEIYLETKQVVEDIKIPILIGGEHSITYGSLKACKEIYKEELYVIILDAHLDMKMEYDGVKYSHACISRNIYNEITKNIIFIGPRSGTKEEWKFIINKKILCYTSNDILNRGIQNIISDVMKKIRKNKIYLSIDMDVLDPIYCSGVGTPEPFGIHPNEIYKIIKSFSKKIIGIDIVETTPEYDNELSSVIVNGLLREFIFSSENKNI